MAYMRQRGQFGEVAGDMGWEKGDADHICRPSIYHGITANRVSPVIEIVVEGTRVQELHLIYLDG